MSFVLVLGFLFDTHTSVDVTAKTAQFGVPKESYSLAPETNVQKVETRETFIASVQTALRNQPERVVVKKEEVKVSEPIAQKLILAPVPPVIETVPLAQPDIQQASSTTPEAQGEVVQLAL
jgi:hypothetical protein